MAIPTTQVRMIPNVTATTAVDTAAKRRAAIASETSIATSTGGLSSQVNPADFGTVNISGGPADSGVLHLMWSVTNAQGNTSASSFILWMSTFGSNFAKALTAVNFRRISGADVVTPTNSENYIANALTSSYTFAALQENGTAPAANLGSAGDDSLPSASSINITTPGTTDDVVFWASHMHVDTGETTGTYTGNSATTGLQASFQYTYA